MAIVAKCDRCGTQTETSGSVVGLMIGIMQTRQTKLPAGWHRVPEPVDGEEIDWPRRELCPGCVDALRAFFQGDGAVPGLLEPESLAAVDGCNCPQPETPRPPCPAHEQCENCGHAPHGHAEHLTDPATLKDCPDCPCAMELREMDGEKSRPLRMEDSKRAKCQLGIHETNPEGPAGVCRFCGGQWGSPRDTDVPRLEPLPRCTCAGAGYGTEDCVVHHPDGLEKGTHLKCHQEGTERYGCPGIYRRGMFLEHMARWHGVKVAEKSKPCPFCAEITDGILRLGPHIAKDHPGDWQAWIDSGQRAG